MKSTPEDIKRLVVEYGYTDQQLADQLGITPVAAKKRRLNAGLLRAPRHPEAKPKTPEQLAHYEALLYDGLSFRAISEMTGVKRTTLAKHFPGRGFTEEQAREAARLSKQAYWLYEKLDREAA